MPDEYCDLLQNVRCGANLSKLDYERLIVLLLGNIADAASPSGGLRSQETLYAVRDATTLLLTYTKILDNPTAAELRWIHIQNESDQPIFIAFGPTGGPVPTTPFDFIRSNGSLTIDLAAQGLTNSDSIYAAFTGSGVASSGSIYSSASYGGV